MENELSELVLFIVNKFYLKNIYKHMIYTCIKALLIALYKSCTHLGIYKNFHLLYL